jgi:hypothetical protein
MTDRNALLRIEEILSPHRNATVLMDVKEAHELAKMANANPPNTTVEYGPDDPLTDKVTAFTIATNALVAERRRIREGLRHWELTLMANVEADEPLGPGLCLALANDLTALIAKVDLDG